MGHLQMHSGQPKEDIVSLLGVDGFFCGFGLVCRLLRGFSVLWEVSSLKLIFVYALVGRDGGLDYR